MSDKERVSTACVQKAAYISLANETGVSLYQKNKLEEAAYHFSLALARLIEIQKDIERSSANPRASPLEFKVNDHAESYSNSTYELARQVNHITVTDLGLPILIIHLASQNDDTPTLRTTKNWITCACLASMINASIVHMRFNRLQNARSTLKGAISMWQNELKKNDQVFREAYFQNSQFMALLMSLHLLSGQVSALLDEEIVNARSKVSSAIPTLSCDQQMRFRRKNSFLAEESVQNFQYALDLGAMFTSYCGDDSQTTQSNIELEMANYLMWERNDLKAAASAFKDAIKSYTFFKEVRSNDGPPPNRCSVLDSRAANAA